MAHWDGFQSATTAFKSTWTVEVTVVNGGSKTKTPPLPVLFIPPCDDDEKAKRKLKILDSYLEPFIRELSTLFVEGIAVDYNYPAELIDGSPMSAIRGNACRLRAILVLFTGDHPAQCKFGGWNDRGLAGCRRCQLNSYTASNSGGGIGQVKYDKNREQMRYPPPTRKIEDCKEGATRLSTASTLMERKLISRQCGMNCKTRAWRLYELNGFCLANDLVYDTMHILALCLFKKYCELLVGSASSSVHSDQAKKLEAALQEVTKKRPKRFDGRWPKDPLTRLGYFKAEEFTRFVMFCVPHILYVMGIDIHSTLGTLGLLLVDIARLFYIRSRSEGWTPKTMEIAKCLLAAWRVRSEETLGPNGAILEHVAGKESSATVCMHVMTSWSS